MNKVRLVREPRACEQNSSRVPRFSKNLVTSLAPLARLKTSKERLRVIRGVLQRLDMVAGWICKSHTATTCIGTDIPTTVLP